MAILERQNDQPAPFRVEAKAENGSGSGFVVFPRGMTPSCLAHDPIGKPEATFEDHARAAGEESRGHAVTGG